MTTNYKTFLLQPGDGLLISANIDTYAHHWDAYMEASGVPQGQLTNTPLATVPLPIYPDYWPRGHRRWAGTKPEFMWHPFMWLPPRLAHPTQLADGTTEPFGQWIVRVMMEVVFAELYNPETGEWLDVLASIGIDLDNPIDYLRVEGWLDGDQDAALDNIDLTVYLQGNEQGMVEMAAEDTPGMIAVTATNMARETLGYVEDALAFIEETSVYQHQLNAATSCVFAAYLGIEGFTDNAGEGEELANLWAIYGEGDSEPDKADMVTAINTCGRIAQAVLDKYAQAADDFIEALEESGAIPSE